MSSAPENFWSRLKSRDENKSNATQSCREELGEFRLSIEDLETRIQRLRGITRKWQER